MWPTPEPARSHSHGQDKAGYVARVLGDPGSVLGCGLRWQRRILALLFRVVLQQWLTMDPLINRLYSYYMLKFRCHSFLY